MPRTKQFDRTEKLERAVELFQQKGFHATSMQDIVSELGINRASLYDTFGDKHSLFVEALIHYRNNQYKQLGELVTDVADPISFLKDFFKNSIREGLEEGKGCFMVNTSIDLAPHDDQVKKIIVGNMLSFEQKFEQFFQIGQDDGMISRDFSPKEQARYLYNTMVGIRTLSRTIRDEQVLNGIIETALSVFRP